MSTHHIVVFGKQEITIPRLAGKIKDLLNTFEYKKTCEGSDFNGYGYQTHTYRYFMPNRKAYNAIKKFLAEKKSDNKKPKVEKTFEEKKAEWCRRLVKLTGISYSEANDIADEKIEYKNEKIDEMYDRQNERFSIKRSKLISRMERENPLRRIKDECHAQAILEASYRHNNTAYDEYLEDGREQAILGNIDRGDVKAYAREQIRKDMNNIEDSRNNDFKKYLLRKFSKIIEDKTQDYLFFDTETTGLGTEDEVIELAIVDSDGNKVYESRFNPTSEIDPMAQEVHGLSKEILKDSPCFKDEYQKIQDIIKDKVLFAYNVNFDKRMLESSCRKYNLPVFDNVEYMDLAVIKEENRDRIKYYNLNALMELTETPFRQDRTIHGALVDTYAIYDLFTQDN